MGPKKILEVIDEMREKSCIVEPSLSGTVNVLLRSEQVEVLYELLSLDNMMIILRCIARQSIRLRDYYEVNFKINLFDGIVKEKALENEMLIKLFKAAMKEAKYEVFVEVCDLLHRDEIN